MPLMQRSSPRKVNIFVFFFFGMNRNGRIVGRERILGSLMDRQTDGLLDGPLYSILYSNKRVDEETIKLIKLPS